MFLETCSKRTGFFCAFVLYTFTGRLHATWAVESNFVLHIDTHDLESYTQGFLMSSPEQPLIEPNA